MKSVVKNRYLLLFAIVLMATAVHFSIGSAERMLVSGEVKGASVVQLYRSRNRITFSSDTPSAHYGWILMNREYGEWGEWSDWSINETVASDRTAVETRTGESGKTEYRFCTRSCLYTYGKWDEWSDWTTEAISEDENRQVENSSFSVLEVPDTAVNAQTVSRISMIPGTGTQLAVTEESGTIQWQSDNPAIASVNMSGYVTAQAEGNTTISAKNSRGISIAGISVHVLGSSSRLPEGVTVIAEEAFYGTSMEVLDLRNTDLSEIRDAAFSGSESLKLVLTDGMTGRIEDDAFEGSGNVSVASASQDSFYQLAGAKGLPRYIWDAPKPYVPVSGISMNHSSLTLHIGESELLQASVSPAAATIPYFRWYSYSEAVQVDDFGLVTAMYPGTAVIRVKTLDGKYSADCNVTVEAVPVTSVLLDAASLELTEGESALLTATMLPADATDPSVIWTSSNPNVAQVIDGTVTAMNRGRAIIRASSTDDGRATAACEVLVLSSAIQDSQVYTETKAVNVTATDATICTTVNITENPDILGFYFGTDPEYLKKAAIEDTSRLGSTLLTEISYNMAEWKRTLWEDTTYYYQFYMTWGENTLVSEICSFRTAEEAEGPESDLLGKGSNDIIDNTFFTDFYISELTETYVWIHAEFEPTDELEEVGCQLLFEDLPLWDFYRDEECLGWDNNYDFYFRLDREFNGGAKKMLDCSMFGYRLYYNNFGDPGLRFTDTRYFSRDSQQVVTGDKYFESVTVTDLTEESVTISAEIKKYSSIVPVESVHFHLLYQDQNIVKSANDVSQSYDAATNTYHLSFTFALDSDCEEYEYQVRYFYNTVWYYSDIKVFRKPEEAPPENEVTVRVASIGNMLYSTERSEDFWGFLRQKDGFGNDPAARINAENFADAYSSTTYAGSDNVSLMIDPKTVSVFKSFVLSRFENADDNDISILFVGGHGGYNGSYATVLTGDNEYVWETTYREIADNIQGIKIFIVDTCQSGRLVEYFRNNRKGNLYVISASKVPEKNGDLSASEISTKPGGGTTFLTHHFLKGIGQYTSGKMPADSDGNNEVTFSEIYSYVYTHVENDTSVFSTALPYIKYQQPQAFYGGAADPVIFKRDSR